MVGYAEAGAEALLIQSTGPLDHLLAAGQKVKEATGLPLIAVPTSFPSEPARRFWDSGFDVVVRAHQLLQAGVAAQAAILPLLLDASRPPSELQDRLAAHADIDIRRI
jgi:phosphoenolpyruvate phosphomutase